MALRGTVFQHCRLGPEVVPGTPVSVTKRLLNTGITINPVAPAEPYRPVGSKYATGVILQKETTTGTFEGALSFNDIIYILSSVLRKAATPGTWVFDSQTWDPDSPQTYTVHRGSPTRAEGTNFLLFTGMEINLSRTAATCRGDVLGRVMEENVTMVTPTEIPSMPVFPKEIEIQVGDSEAGLTKITRCTSFTMNIRNRYLPGIFFDPAEESYVDIVEGAPDFTASLQVERNSVASGYMADLRTAKQKFLKFTVLGPPLATTGNHSIECIMPFQFQSETSDDVDGVYGATFPLVPDHESTFGKAVEFTVVNDLATL